MKAQPCDTVSGPPNSKLATHKVSHVISKLKPPKIRIIHIFAPKIIKTDVANFRELVQRLTGKPAEKIRDNKKTTASIDITTKESRTISCDKPSKIMDTRDGIQILQNGERILKKEKRDLWGGGGCENSSGFLGGFLEIDSMFPDFSEYPFLPLRSSSHMNVFGDMPLR